MADHSSLDDVLTYLRDRTTSDRRLVVGIGGPGGSGKSTLADWMAQRLPDSAVVHLDDFRLPRSQRKRHAPYGSHPDANNIERLRGGLAGFRAHGSVVHPVIDPISGEESTPYTLSGMSVLLVEGEIAAYDMLAKEWDLLILLQTSFWQLLKTRWIRDRQQRGYTWSKMLRVIYHSTIKDYPRFAKHASSRADILLRRTESGEWKKKRG